MQTVRLGQEDHSYGALRCLHERYEYLQASMQRSSGSVTTASRDPEDYPETVSEFRITKEAVVSSGANYARFVPSLRSSRNGSDSRSRSNNSRDYKIGGRLPICRMNCKAEVRRRFFLNRFLKSFAQVRAIST